MSEGTNPFGGGSDLMSFGSCVVYLSCTGCGMFEGLRRLMVTYLVWFMIPGHERGSAHLGACVQSSLCMVHGTLC